MNNPNNFIHTRSYLSTLQKFNSSSQPTTPKLTSPGVIGTIPQNQQNTKSANTIGTSSNDLIVNHNTNNSNDEQIQLLINNLSDDEIDEESKEEILRKNLSNLIGRPSTDEEILQLMHAHKDDLSGTPFNNKRTPSRPVSRPWTPTQGPSTPTFGKITPLMLSPSLSNSTQTQSFLPPGLSSSQPSSPLASPRLLNIKAAEFKPPTSPSSLSYTSTNNNDNDEQFDSDCDFDQQFNYQDDVSFNMTPLDVLWTIFAPSGLSYEDLESTLTANGFDFELTLNDLSDRNAPLDKLGNTSNQDNQLNNLRHHNPAGGRVCRYYLAGECRRSDCRFSHEIERALCRFWLRGNCIKQNCDFLHQLPPKSEVENTLVSMFNKSADIEEQAQKEELSRNQQIQSVEDAFPTLHTGVSLNGSQNNSSKKQRQYTPRWSTAVKSQPKPNLYQQHQQQLQQQHQQHQQQSILSYTNNRRLPRSSPRIRLKAPTLLPTLPTGSTLNALYMTYRNSSISLGKARNSLLSKAAEAYRRGDGASAKQFSREAHELNERMTGENADAASRLVKERRKAIQNALVSGVGTSGYEGDMAGRRFRGKECGNGLGVILGMSEREGLLSGDERMEAVLDLHGLHSSEGVDVIEEFLLSLEREHFLGLAYIVVGESKHTGTQDPLRGSSKLRLSAGVRDWLDKWGYPTLEVGGSIVVDPITHY